MMFFTPSKIVQIPSAL